MRFLHIGDLHIGKRVHERSMIDEQKHAFDQIIGIARSEQVDAVLIAGDVFDRPQPPREALEECERLYAGLIEAGAKVYVIPGNHDSAQQVAFCSGITAAAGLHIARAYHGKIQSYRLQEDGQTVCIHLLPFVRPTDVRMALPHRADEVRNHDDAVRIALEEHDIDPSVCNILVAHQFVTDGATGPQLCESETVSVGGIDNVQASNFDAFDYVALGHLHGPQQVRRPQVRYSGSPVRYSFSEANQRKVAVLVEVSAGGVSMREIEIEPIHKMREVKMSYQQLADGADNGCHDDYMHVTLTDTSLYDALAKVRAIYPNLLRLDWEQSGGSGSFSTAEVAQVKRKSLSELFSEFYASQTGADISPDSLREFESIVANKGEVAS